ncbi:hypothetical protein E2C01_101047 [Portunus trituberculatus]|uniref:Uncharacterized protein n=1 Tax=Portunus trituberculatus TaxID=210409 RepID=A0A5B7K4P4_PORTR|nr:hypothetical protein [Portunus trituberculatus]
MFPHSIFFLRCRTKFTEAYKAHDETDRRLPEILKNKVRKISKLLKCGRDQPRLVHDTQRQDRRLSAFCLCAAVLSGKDQAAVSQSLCAWEPIRIALDLPSLGISGVELGASGIHWGDPCHFTIDPAGRR